MAKLVHEASPRCEKGVLVKVNCAAIPENLMESEFFGYESGAFTGARSGGKPGYFEIADQGTLFLDEIGELPLAMQAKLLTVLQDRQVIRIGGARPISVNCRLISATNRDLEKMVRKGLFREELFYPYQCRSDPHSPSPKKGRMTYRFLLAYFLEQHNRRYNLRIRFSPRAIEALCRYYWPGNVRQLMNLVERFGRDSSKLANRPGGHTGPPQPSSRTL